FTGQVINNDTVQLSWTKPSAGNPTGYKIYRGYSDMWSNEGYQLLALTDTLGFADPGLPEEKYVYSVKAVYPENDSRFSYSFEADIINIPQFPKITSLAANVSGRTSIDLQWVIPFTGLINYDQDFEDGGGSFPAGWQQWQYLGSGLNYWLQDDSNGDYITITDKWTNPHIVLRPGEYALIVSTGHTYPAFFTTPEFTLASDTFIRFWTRFKGNPDTQQYPRFSVVTKTGVWSGRTINVTRHATFDGDPGDPDYHEWDDYESEWEIPITGFGGTAAFVGFEVVPSDNFYTMSFDDITVGQYSGGVAEDPVGFDIYRNGSPAAAVSSGTTCEWSDTNFADGDNEYFIKALYPAGSSIPSDHETAFMDANPAPDYLTADTSTYGYVDLSWYMPNGTPPHWAGYIEPRNCTTAVDNLPDTPCSRRRVEFHAEDLGLYYPVTIDSIAAAFYEFDDDPWGSANTFIFRLWDGDPDTGTLLWQSGTLTAAPNEIFKYGLPGPYVVNNEWNVEVETTDTAAGHPSTLAGVSTDYINSYFYYEVQASYNYYIISDKKPLSYCFMAYCTSSDPDPIAKSGWRGNTEVLKGFGIEDKRDRNISGIKTNGKALDHYIIYRDSVAIGTSTTTSYSDLVMPPPLNRDQKYYAQYFVTAYYSNPQGESEPSNDVWVDIFLPDPDPYTPDVSIVKKDSVYVLQWEYMNNWDYTHNIYASDDPYFGFTLIDTIVSFDAWKLFEWEIPLTDSKKFYYVIVESSKKSGGKNTPEKIFLQKDSR
ncbi:MAG: fibronectin type III domain-containing protein, partial [Candidatus Delongbacteria bacterium]